MTELLIFIHHHEQCRETVDDFANAICPHLGTLGERASISTIDRVRKLADSNDALSATVLRLSLAGTSRVDFTETMANLAGYLRFNIKNAKLEYKFDIWRIELASPTGP